MGGWIADESESVFQRRVTELAEQHGWEWMHVGRVGKYAPNGAKGTLGIGWPDLTLLRGDTLVFAELKAQKAPPPTVSQQLVLARLGETGAGVFVWRPSDWPLILDVLTA